MTQSAPANTSLSDDIREVRDRSMPAAESLNPYQSPRYYQDEPATLYERPSKRGMFWILFSFEGRIPRRVFWGATIFTTVVFYATVFSLAAIFGEDSPIWTIGVPVAYILMIWVSLAIQVKRWHDRDKSGWWVLIGFLPIIGPIWQFVETGCLRGTIGSNRYGSDLT
jgi:uncharacterized membrane protein YhaH (DUF805 family)